MRKLRFVFGLLLFALCSSNLAFGQHASWQRKLLHGYKPMVATDPAGNTYMFGYFRQANASFPTLMPPFAYGQDDLFLARYDAQGNQTWLKRIGGTTNDWPEDVAVDTAGNVYILATTFGAYEVGSLSHNAAGNFVAKIDAAGNTLWLEHFNGGANSNQNLSMRSLVTDEAGNYFVAGDYYGLTSIGGQPMSGQPGCFVVKGNAATGDLTFATEFGGSALVTDLALTPTGDMLLTGSFVWQMNFGGSPAANISSMTANYNPFVAKLNPQGQGVWAAAAVLANGMGWGNAVAADAAGNVYLTGEADGSLSIDGLTTSQQGFYLAKFSPAGQVLWLQGQTNANSYHNKAEDLVIDSQGRVYVTGSFGNEPMTVGTVTLNGPSTVFDMATFLVAFDPDGTTLWGRSAIQCGFSIRNVGTSLGIDAADNLYLAGWKEETEPAYGGACQMNFLNLPISGEGVFLYRITQGSTVAGTVFIDQNGNGIFDSGEPPFAHPVVVFESFRQQFFSSNNSGQYRVNISAGNYNVSVPGIPAYYTLSVPASGAFTGTFTALGQVHPDRHIGLQPVANQQDLQLTLTAFSQPRPGMAAKYRLTVRNVGTTTIPAGTVTLQPDPLLTYSSSLPAGNVNGQTLTWAYTALPPMAQLNLNAIYMVPPNVSLLGTVLTTTAWADPLTGDLTPADNAETKTQIITGSYDPNDKQVSHTEITPAQVQSQQELDYTIRFQNMGTDTAFTVLIKDELMHNRLDPATISLLSSSHTCTWSLDGAGVLQVKFANILLPHEAVNEPGSQGFVRFRIKPRTSVLLGQKIQNTAGIYFDFNAPVITNTTETEVVQFLAAAGLLMPDLLQLYPNPAADAVTVRALIGRFAEAKLCLLNVLGQEVYSSRVATAGDGFEQEISLRNLPSGVYMVRLQTEQGSVLKQLVKQ